MGIDIFSIILLPEYKKCPHTIIFYLLFYKVISIGLHSLIFFYWLISNGLFFTPSIFLLLVHTNYPKFPIPYNFNPISLLFSRFFLFTELLPACSLSLHCAAACLFPSCFSASCLLCVLHLSFILLVCFIYFKEVNSHFLIISFFFLFPAVLVTKLN